MTIYVADLSSTSGWTERWNTGYASTSASGGVFTVTQTSSGAYGFSWNTIDSDSNRANVEVLAKVRHTNYLSSGTSYGVGVFVRGSGTSSTETHYSAFIYVGTSGSNAPFVQYVNNGGFNTPLDFSTPVDVGEDTWCWIKLRANGSSIKTKAWLDGDGEPTEWTTEDTDSTITAAGWVGIFTSNNVADPYDIGYFAVATNGDSISSGGSARVQFIGI